MNIKFKRIRPIIQYFDGRRFKIEPHLIIKKAIKTDCRYAITVPTTSNRRIDFLLRKSMRNCLYYDWFGARVWKRNSLESRGKVILQPKNLNGVKRCQLPFIRFV